MGAMSELVVGDDGDGEKIANSLPSIDLGGVDVNGIDPVNLGTLHSIVTGRDYRQMSSLYGLDFAASDQGPWVIKVPSELVDALGVLTQAQQDEFSSRWAETDELDDWSVDNVKGTLRVICDQARRASASSQRLFLWLSL